MVAGIALIAVGLKQTLAHVDEPLKLVPAVALLGGAALYLLAHVAFRLRNMHTLSARRLLCAIVLLALLPARGRRSRRWRRSAILAALLAALIAYEALRYAEVARPRPPPARARTGRRLATPTPCCALLARLRCSEQQKNVTPGANRPALPKDRWTADHVSNQRRSVHMSRRAIVPAVVLVLAVACLPAAASAAPTVTFKARAVPIPGFRGTGNILGAGAALQVQYTISGTEYGGFPPPLIGVNFFTPAGTRLHPRGFATCSPAALQNRGPGACPRRSRVTLSGTALGVVSFGSERVQERASIQAFFAPGGALQFYTQGSSPVSLEFLSPSHVVGTGRPYAQKFVTSVPLIATVPGRAVRVGAVDQPEDRRGVSPGQEGHLLRQGAQALPEGRLPAEVGTAVRRGRRSRAADGARHLQGAVPGAPPRAP